LKKAVVSISIILLLSFLCLTIIPQNVSSKTQDIKVVSYSHYVDALGLLEIVGEIQNVGTSTIERVVLNVLVYGADGTLQGNVTGYNWLSYLVPQQRSPFRFEVVVPAAYRTDDVSGWYSVGVSRIVISVIDAAETSSYFYSDFEVSVNSAGVSTSGVDAGTYWVSGAVKNVGSQTASRLAVAAVYYNASGTVVAIGRTDYLTPTNLSPSEKVAFKVGAFDTFQTDEVDSRIITSYALFVQTESPLLGGKPPVATAPVTGTSMPSQSGNDSGVMSNQNLIYILVIVAVIVAVIAALIVSRRGGSSKAKGLLGNNVYRQIAMLAIWTNIIHVSTIASLPEV
jgi:hypothetical protein